MAGGFDPYRLWLGIVQKDRPPNHYQLLKLEVFTRDDAAISTAAAEQLARVERYYDSRYDETARRLAQEVCAARDCLLDSAQKARYDATLRARLVPVAVAEPPKAVPPDVLGVRSSSGRRAKRWYHSQWFQIPVGGIAGILIALPFAGRIRACRQRTPVAEATFESSMSPSPLWPELESSQNDVESPLVPTVPGRWPPLVNTDETSETAEDAVDDAPAAQDAETPHSINPGMSEPPEPEDLDQQADVLGDETLDEEPLEGDVDSAATDAEPNGKVVSESIDRLPIPEEAERREAELYIQKLLRGEFETAKTREEILAQAQRLVDLAGQSQDKPAVRYVLLQMAAERTTEAGDLTMAVTTIDQVAAVYDTDPWTRKTAALAAALNSVRQARAAGISGEATLAAAAKLLDQALAEDAYPAAGEMLPQLISSAQRAKLAVLARELIQRKREVQRLEEEFAAFQSAVELRDQEPEHGEANKIVGRWLALVKGQWDEALPRLAKGSDADLAKLAQSDLAAPTTGEAQAALARAWWQQAAAETDGNRSMAARRAVFWYDRALTSLTGLPEIEAAQARLEALSTAGAPKASEVSGAVEEGDVALSSKGPTVIGANITSPAHLLDGVLTTYASAKCPCELTIRLGKTYRLQEIRLHLLSPTAYSYLYAIATSTDGRNFVPLTERTSRRQAGFEQIRFDARTVVAIRLLGLASTASKNLYVL